MQIIDPHIHMMSRTVDDYRLMADAGIVAVCEPAFWPGLDRHYPESLLDYFNLLTTFEPQRAAKRGIKHFCVLGLNAKEADKPELAEPVLERIEPYLDHPTVLGIGEIGLNMNTDNELRYFRRQMEMAIDRDVICVIHTPHAAQKKRGTEMIIEVIEELDAPREKIVIDHCTGETIEMARATGCWTGLTVYPGKLSPEEAAGIVRDYGAERMLVNSSADWEESDPLAVVATIGVMREYDLTEGTIRRVVEENPATYLGQSPRFELS